MIDLPPAGKPKNILEYYSLINFAIEDYDVLEETLDYNALQFLIRSFGEHLNRFFYSRGGYSLRETINEYSVFFPNNDLDSVLKHLEEFAASLKETGIPGTTVRPFADESISVDTVIITVYAGLALGKPQIEKELVLEYARFSQEIFARFLFDRKARQSGN